MTIGDKGSTMQLPNLVYAKNYTKIAAEYVALEDKNRIFALVNQRHY